MERKRPIYGYDVYYRLETSSSILVAAHNQKEAKEEFEKWLETATRDEIIERFLSAFDFHPDIKVTFIDRVDKFNEEDMEILHKWQDKEMSKRNKK